MKQNKIICFMLCLFCLLSFAPVVHATETDLSYDAARAYLKIMDDLVAQNGYAESTSSMSGLGYARLIDFDSDGYTELLIAANGAYDVYGYYKNGLVHLHHGDCWAIGGFFDLDLLKKGYNTFIATSSIGDTSLCSIGTYYGTVENQNWVTDELIEHSPCEPEVHIGSRNWYDFYYLLNGNVISEAEYNTYLMPFTNVDVGTSYDRYSKNGTKEARKILENTIRTKKPISVTVNGKEVSFDQPPVIVKDRTLVPVRAVVEAMNGTVDWDADTQSITMKVDNTVIRLVIGSTTASVHKHIEELDVPPQIIGNRTLLPIRFVAERFGYQVDWDADTRTVIIY